MTLPLQEIQLINAIEFGGSGSLKRERFVRRDPKKPIVNATSEDFSIEFDEEYNMVRVENRSTKKAQLIPIGNVKTMVELGKPANDNAKGSK